MFVRIAILTVLLTSTARAGGPSAYQCSPGTAKAGVGCVCPAGYGEKRDAENTAICAKRLITVTDKPKADGTQLEPIDTTLVASKADCSNPADCTRLAFKLDVGEGVAVDKPHAAKLFERACTASNLRACAELAERFEYGHGVEVDKDKARPLLQRACDLGSGEACHGLAAAMLPDRSKADPLYARAFTLLDAGCKKGNPVDCYELGTLYQFGSGVKEDTKKAADLDEQACNAGFGKACESHAHSYENGSGRTKDLAKALAFMERACNTGHPHGCAGAGRLIKDPAQAGLSFAAGCRHGSFYGCLQLAIWFKNTDQKVLDQFRWKGPITQKERNAYAIQAYELSCQYSAYNRACTDLADHYLSGDRVKPDKARARALLARACNGGESVCGRAGKMFETGEGGPVDRDAAAALYDSGCNKYEKALCDARDRLRKP
jgi:uncharacterized protein